MPLARRGRLRLAAFFWLGGLLAAILALERPAPLFVNLGAGDAPFARGFRGGWERDGLRQSGETMFRWTLDGSRVELPVRVLTGDLRARMRLARFAPGSADVSLLSGGGERDRWTHPSQGWRVRDVALGGVRGPLTLTFRSHSDDAAGLGVALDWLEVTGAGVIVPRLRVLGGLALLLLGVPMLVGLFFRSGTAALTAGALLLAMTTAVLMMDRLGGLVGLSRAGGPALLALMGLALAARAIRRGWSEPFDNDNARATELNARATLAIPAIAVVIALVAVSHPFYYYPDVDTHARYLAAARADPRLLIDPGEYQARTGAWTRDVGGRRVAFPYSPVFHILAWPLAVLVGDELAVKCLAATALGLTVLLVHVLARCLGFAAGASLLAQGLLVLLPVTASRLALALYPALLAQALELMLIVALARGLGDAGGRRSGWALFALLTACQAAYTGSLLNVGVMVAILAAVVAASGERVGALRLAGLYLAATAAVVAAQYALFLPVLWRDVLPHVASAGAAGAQDQGGLVTRALRRLGLFYDVVYPLMLVPGLMAARAAPAAARRSVTAALLAGGSLLILRYAVPVVFRDAKEVELLAGPVAALAAGGGLWLWRRGPAPRIAAGLALLTAAAWGASRAALAYGERFVAVGR